MPCKLKKSLPLHLLPTPYINLTILSNMPRLTLGHQRRRYRLIQILRNHHTAAMENLPLFPPQLPNMPVIYAQPPSSGSPPNFLDRIRANGQGSISPTQHQWAGEFHCDPESLIPSSTSFRGPSPSNEPTT